MRAKERHYSGTRNSGISERERNNRKVAREAAAEGIVLLKNDGVLPLKPGIKAALCGGGAVCTVKGGTGSGDVNEREVVSIYQGFLDAGIQLTNREWLDSYTEIYRREREHWRDVILNEMKDLGESNLLHVYSNHVFRMPKGNPMKETDFEGAEIAFYVISRTSGEDADRFKIAGDYDLTEDEKQDLAYLSKNCENIAVIINAGGQIDVKDILAVPNLKALICVSQPGMEGGHALADILTGVVTPSGKLTDTWAKDYFDFPNSRTFSHNNGNVQKEYYEEGIYVGYRYFDSFEKEVQYPFGFGLSYTSFSIKTEKIETEGNKVAISMLVKNTGNVFAGKEVVQIYVSCPQSGLEKEFRRLCGFTKTELLNPGESSKVSVQINAKDLASFDESGSQWILEKGVYGIWAGNSSRNLSLVGALQVEEEVVLENVRPICPVKETLTELTKGENTGRVWEEKWHSKLKEEQIIPLVFTPSRETAGNIPEGKAEKAARSLTERLNPEQLIAMVIGEVSKGQGQALGSSGIMVPGAAGETSSVLEKEYGVPGVSMADGPAGLRLMKTYEVDCQKGTIYNQGILGALEGGFFAEKEPHENAETWYQYCTAIPVGTMLAQTWNTKLCEKVGEAVAVEMEEFGISWWLAPGMNIHRNPLCGRNFEYYSEDPFLSGHMASAITGGVQKLPGVGTAIKHFACNNQEDNRMGSDSILSERALREIYLKGFEIAVKTAQPMAIMTSYNMINGVHTANSRDLCMQVAREEWGFQGIIMTDWTTTMPRGGSSSWKCVKAGNDLIMPGYDGDFKDIQEALDSGKLSLNDLKECVKRLLTVIFQTNAYEGAESYRVH